jgi:hypothetical protein
MLYEETISKSGVGRSFGGQVIVSEMDFTAYFVCTKSSLLFIKLLLGQTRGLKTWLIEHKIM